MVREESRSNWIRHFLGTRYIMKDGCGVGVKIKKKPLGFQGAMVLGDDLLSHRVWQYHRRGRA